jgi:protocatechuate 3,4-dioxygenase beta subunit
MSAPARYRPVPPGLHPPNDSPEYRSTLLRCPRQPLVAIPQTLSEITGPTQVQGRIGPLDHDLTRQHAGPPLGERIILGGRVLDEDGGPARETLVELVAVQRGRPLRAPRRRARRAAGPELHRRRAAR